MTACAFLSLHLAPRTSCDPRDRREAAPIIIRVVGEGEQDHNLVNVGKVAVPYRSHDPNAHVATPDAFRTPRLAEPTFSVRSLFVRGLQIVLSL